MSRCLILPGAVPIAEGRARLARLIRRARTREDLDERIVRHVGEVQRARRLREYALGVLRTYQELQSRPRRLAEVLRQEFPAANEKEIREAVQAARANGGRASEMTDVQNGHGS